MIEPLFRLINNLSSGNRDFILFAVASLIILHIISNKEKSWLFIEKNL